MCSHVKVLCLTRARAVALSRWVASLMFLLLLRPLSKRIYVHESAYDEFVTQYVDLVKVSITLGRNSCAAYTLHERNMSWVTPPSKRLPLDQSSVWQVPTRFANKFPTPVRFPRFPCHQIGLIKDLVKAGATALIPENLFSIAQP